MAKNKSKKSNKGNKDKKSKTPKIERNWEELGLMMGLEIHQQLNTSIESKVALIKSFPGINSDIIDYHIDKGYKGLLIEGTGLGHVPDYMVDTLKRANDEGIPVVMTSQCLYGTINMNVYSTGRLLLDAGVISGRDMTPETAYVKLAWALGQTDDLNEVKDIIQTNIAGELNESSSLKYFLN